MNNDNFGTPRKQSGYEKYRQAAGSLPSSKFPWGTLIGNAIGIAVAHTAGQYAGGALVKALSASPRFSQHMAAVNPRLLSNALSVAGAISATTASLGSLAGQLRTAEEIARLKREEERAIQEGNEKKASVLRDYARVLGRLNR